ncbi:methyltransferase domain-containing protein [Natronomonas halophila]|uniref:methyltransferase domain-containing protein n=1 Tax=Natronomonas halophila TaxID=2747817 RepID=UPI0015B39955|nr:methyltransferase domain-containing protein [Natronomonas halophila]
MELAGDDDAFALREAESRASDVELLAPGLATARGVRRAETLAYTRRVCRLVGTCKPEVDAAVAVLKAATIDRQGTVAVRARDVRGRTDIDTQAVERRLGSVLVDRGFDVDLDDPDHTLVALFSDSAALGWLDTETMRDFGDRQPTEKPFFQPGSMDPMDARALANIAGAGPETRLLDPMCGTGGILVEAGLAGSDVVGVDAQEKMARGARKNLDHYLDDGEVVRADATRLPFADDSFDGRESSDDSRARKDAKRPFDGVVFDAPYGRQSKIESVSLDALVGDALAEVRRVAPKAVLVADRPWNDAAEDAGWTVESRFDRRVHRSLVRYVHVLV